MVTTGGFSSIEDKRDISQQLLGKQGSFSAYFELYDDLVQRNSHLAVTIDDSPEDQPLTCENILEVARLLRSNVEITKANASIQIKQSLTGRHSNANVEKAINMSVQAMLMIDTAAKDWHSADFVLGDYRPTCWLASETLLDFVRKSFPVGLKSSTRAVRVAVEQRAMLKAWKLLKRLGIRFRRTNNLAEHLLFDQRGNCLYIFHHVAFLKAQLARYQDDLDPLAIDMKESLERGTLPPQLLTETLHSIQGIIFPAVDPQSADILDELIDKRGFDPDCAQYEGYMLFRELPDNFNYLYWGDRIAQLHNLSMRRPPRNKLERWFQRHSTDGNALFIALLALLISIVVGIVSIILGCFQIWISWMAWKYPVISS